MAYDPRAFPAMSPKKKAPPPSVAREQGRPNADQAVGLRLRGAVERLRVRRLLIAALTGALVLLILSIAVWKLTRRPESIPYVPRAIAQGDLDRWYLVVGELSAMKSEGKFGGMPGGPLEFARQQTTDPEVTWKACRKVAVNPVDFLVTCDAIGVAMHVEEQDRRSVESVANEYSLPDIPIDLPEELRVEAEFGMKGAALAPPKLSEHLAPVDKENYRLYQANRENILRALEPVQ